jgi:hypothetical protein
MTFPSLKQGTLDAAQTLMSILPPSVPQTFEKKVQAGLSLEEIKGQQQLEEMILHEHQQERQHCDVSHTQNLDGQ